MAYETLVRGASRETTDHNRMKDERDKLVADEIRAGRCPFGYLKEGQTIGHCPLGFPGCGCGDELMLNEHLKDNGTS